MIIESASGFMIDKEARQGKILREEREIEEVRERD